MEKKQISEEPKWEAKFTATLKNSSPDKIWSFLEDFFGFDKWFPGLTECRGIYGNNGEVGAIRYSASETQSSSSGGMVVNWANKRINAIDNVEKVLVYEFLENSAGYTNFIATFKVIPYGVGGCVIEWTNSLDPLHGMTYEQFVNRNAPRLQLMAQKMEQAAALAL